MAATGEWFIVWPTLGSRTAEEGEKLPPSERRVYHAVFKIWHNFATMLLIQN